MLSTDSRLSAGSSGRIAARAFLGIAFAILAGCATAPRPSPVPVVEVPAAPVSLAAPRPASQPAAAAIPAPPPAAAPEPAPAQAPTVGLPAPAAASRQLMLVESEPAGAVIVVNGRPVGKTPLRLDVPATPLGFFREDLEIRARFVARDESEASRTAVQDFNPRERVPTVIRFTPDGAKRTLGGASPADTAGDPPATAR